MLIQPLINICDRSVRNRKPHGMPWWNQDEIENRTVWGDDARMKQKTAWRAAMIAWIFIKIPRWRCWSGCWSMLIQLSLDVDPKCWSKSKYVVQDVDPKCWSKNEMLIKMLIQNVDPKMKCWSRCWSKMLIQKWNVDPNHVDPNPKKQLSWSNWLTLAERQIH